MAVPDPQTVREIAREHIRSGRADLGVTIELMLIGTILTKHEHGTWCSAVREAIRSGVVTGTADTAASAAHLRQILAFRNQHGRHGFDFDDDDVTAVLDEREQLVARVAELEAERHADTRAVADVFNAAIEQRYVKPALAEVLGGLHRRFADRIAALGQRDDAADGSAL